MGGSTRHPRRSARRLRQIPSPAVSGNALGRPRHVLQPPFNRFLAEWVNAINALVTIGDPGGGGAGRGRTRRQFVRTVLVHRVPGRAVSPVVWWASCSPGLPAACWRFRSKSGTRWRGRPCGHRMRNPDRETTHPPATEARLTDIPGRAATALEPSTVVRGVPPHTGCRGTDHQLRVPRKTRPTATPGTAPPMLTVAVHRTRCAREEPASRGYRRRRGRRHTR